MDIRAPGDLDLSCEINILLTLRMRNGSRPLKKVSQVLWSSVDISPQACLTPKFISSSVGLERQWEVHHIELVVKARGTMRFSRKNTEIKKSRGAEERNNKRKGLEEAWSPRYKANGHLGKIGWKS